MGALLLSDIITAVRARLSDNAFDQGILTDAANYFVSEIYHNTRTRRMEENDTLYIGVNDTTADLPDDIDVITALTVTSPNTYDFKERFLEYGDFMKLYPMWQTSTSTQLQWWTMFANQMRFSAPCLSASTISIDYTRKPTAVEKTSDTFEIDSEYKELVVLGTLARCMEANEDYAEAQSERANLAPLVTAWVRNEARGGGKTGPVIMRANRRSSRYNRNNDW